MKYLGNCIIIDELCKGITVTSHNDGFLGSDSNNIYIYIPIKESGDKEVLFSKFEVNRIPNAEIKELIDSLCLLTEDIIQKNIPLTPRQISSIKQTINSNPPKSAICLESTPAESLVLGKFKSGNNYSIKLGSTVICDLNGENNALRVFSIICSAFYRVIESIRKQINAPE